MDSESINRGSSPRPETILGSSSGRTLGFEPRKHSSNLCPRANNTLWVRRLTRHTVNVEITGSTPVQSAKSLAIVYKES